jgi:hypothetical protein
MKARHVPRRDLFAEVSDGMEALGQAREGKRTLRTHAGVVDGMRSES